MAAAPVSLASVNEVLALAAATNGVAPQQVAVRPLCEQPDCCYLVALHSRPVHDAGKTAVFRSLDAADFFLRANRIRHYAVQHAPLGCGCEAYVSRNCFRLDGGKLRKCDCACGFDPLVPPCA